MSTNLPRKPKNHARSGGRVKSGRYVGVALSVSVFILAGGIFIGRKLIAQDSVRDLESQVREANDNDEFTFFDTLPDRKLNGHKNRQPVTSPPSLPTLKNHGIKQGGNHDLKNAYDRKNKPGDTQSDQSRVEGYTIQVAALRVQDEAEKVIKGLKDRGYPAYLSEINLGTTWYRVRIGWFSYRQEAEKQLHELSEKIGLKGFVVASNK